MMQDSLKQSPYLTTKIINGTTYAVDRRVVERRADGTVIIRDPQTLQAYDPNTGSPIPDSVFDVER